MLCVLIHTYSWKIILKLLNFSSSYIAIFVVLFNDIYLLRTDKSQLDYLFFVQNINNFYYFMLLEIIRLFHCAWYEL